MPEKHVGVGIAARFCEGSIQRHVLTMAGTGAVGLMAVFAVDLLNFVYLAQMHDSTLAAGIAFAAAISNIQLAVCIGLMIGLGAVAGRLIGAGCAAQARQMASCFLVVAAIVGAVMGLVSGLFAPDCVQALGAHGQAVGQAALYLRIIAPALPLIAVGLCLSSLLRAVGDARRALRVTLIGAMVTASLDPILILWLHWGLTGAAISTIASRLATSAAGLAGLRVHGLLERPDQRQILPAARRIGQVALPAIATNLATPVAGAYVTRAMAHFGQDAVSAQAALERIVPVAFALVFALTGSVGPIMAQNLGAGLIGRVRETLMSALRVTLGTVAVTWGILALGEPLVVSVFGLHGVGVEIARLFCRYTVGSYLFVGLLFVANAAFNNLGRPFYSTLFNWGRATLGTIPFVAIGVEYGPGGVLVGFAVGAALFGSAAVLVAFRVVRRLS